MGLSREMLGTPVRYAIGVIARPKQIPPDIAQVREWVSSTEQIPDESLTPDSTIGEVRQVQMGNGKTVAVFDFRPEAPQSPETA